MSTVFSVIILMIDIQKRALIESNTRSTKPLRLPTIRPFYPKNRRGFVSIENDVKPSLLPNFCPYGWCFMSRIRLSDSPTLPFMSRSMTSSLVTPLSRTLRRAATLSWQGLVQGVGRASIGIFPFIVREHGVIWQHTPESESFSESDNSEASSSGLEPRFGSSRTMTLTSAIWPARARTHTLSRHFIIICILAAPSLESAKIKIKAKLWEYNKMYWHTYDLFFLLL